MIHVLCLNPALDKIYEIDGFSAGGVYPGQQPKVYVGGKGINVARVLSQLGESVHLYAFLGAIGADAFREDMQRRCACTFIPVPGACRTTVNVIDRASGRETVLSESGPCIEAAHAAQLMQALAGNLRAGDVVCCSGSVIKGAPKDIYAQVSRLCAQRGAVCTLDCNAGTLPDSLRDAAYALGKPNEQELCALLGEPVTDEPAQLCALARRLMPPYDRLLVSMGEKGGMLVTQKGAYLADVPRVQIVSTVGSGDACFAGALCAMVRGMRDEALLALSMACGVNNAVRGENGSVDAQQVWALAGQIDVRSL